MGGGYDYSRGSTQTDASAAPAYDAPPRTAEEKTRDAVIGAERELSSGEAAAGDVDRASARNDRAQWDVAHARVGAMIGESRVAIDYARATAGGSRTPEVEAALHGMDVRLEALKKANELSAPPKGYTAVKNEDEILSAVRAKPVGGAKLGFPRKEAAIKELLDRLDPAESRALIARLANR